MIEDTRVIKQVKRVIKRSTNNVVKRVLNMHDDIEGREEEITAQIAAEITNHLLEEISFELNYRVIEGITFRAYLYKKKNEEPLTGADIAGVVDINLGNTRVTKAYLAQAKIAKVSLNTLEKEAIGFTNKDIQKQVEDMLFRTNSAYVFMYTKKGIDVVSAHSVKSLNSNKIKIERTQTKDIGSLYEMLLGCWAGDHRLVPYPIDKMDLGRFADYVNANNVLLIEGSRENQDMPKSRIGYIDI